MSTAESSISDEDSDEGQVEPKRFKYTYNFSRRISDRPERAPPKSRRRPSTKDISFQSKDNTMEGIVFDNGAYSIKVNYSFEDEPKVIPNCIMKAKSERKRLFIGSQIDECRDCSGLYYLIPTERGYITKWDVQKPIWDFIFNKTVCPLNNYPVIMTQPLFNFKSIQDCIDEIFFEEYEVSSLYRTNPADLATFKYHDELGSKPPCLIVDCGYSFTHIIPYLEGMKYLKASIRVNVGGKLLTNHLKDIISYRQYHVMEETFVINQVKEDTCFVSEDFKSDIKTASLPASSNHIVKNYVLPDFNNIRRGYIQNPDTKDEIAESCQILRLNNERFTVPEILFHPSDIGIKSIGIAEAIHKAIFLCPQFYQKALAKNIVCIGGSSKFPGFRSRVEKEIRALIPEAWEVNVFQPENPVGYAWAGGKALFKSPELKSKLVTRQQYEECGLGAIQEKFNDWSEPQIHCDRPAKQEIAPISYIDHVKKYDIFGKGLEEVAEKAVSGENLQGKDDEANGDEKKSKESDNSDEDDDKSLSNELDKKSEVKASGKVVNKKNRSSSTPIVYSVKILSAGKPS